MPPSARSSGERTGPAESPAVQQRRPAAGCVVAHEHSDDAELAVVGRFEPSGAEAPAGLTWTSSGRWRAAARRDSARGRLRTWGGLQLGDILILVSDLKPRDVGACRRNSRMASRTEPEVVSTSSRSSRAIPPRPLQGSQTTTPGLFYSFCGFASKKSFTIGTMTGMRSISVMCVVLGNMANLDAERGRRSP